MKTAILLFLLMPVLALAGHDDTTENLPAAGFVMSGEVHKSNIPKGQWLGQLLYPNVYCAMMPSPENAESVVQAMFNGNRIYLARVDYSDALSAFIVFSSIPDGRFVEDEMDRILLDNRKAEKNTGHSLGITEFNTRFGPTVGLKIKNVSVNIPNQPFPLVRPVVAADLPTKTLSVHRLFARGKDRFEIATYGQIAENLTEQDLTDRLTQMADAIVTSLQTCTAARIPLKT